MQIRFPRVGSIDTSIAEFQLFIEELEHAGELLETKRLARERMALLILDSMADRLLYQHAERYLKATESVVWRNDRQYSTKERNRILSDFGSKVRLAQQEKEFPYPDALLDDLDAAIFRVAHSFRNAGYHRGEHNNVLTGPLARLYAQAVARALPRSCGRWLTGGFDDSLVAELDRFDWREPEQARGTFSPRPAAERIGSQITAALTVDVANLADELVTDFGDRCDAARELLDSPRLDGQRDEEIQIMLDAAMHWARHRGDERLLQLKEEEHGLIEEFSRTREVTDEHREAARKNSLAKFERLRELEQTTEVKFDLGSVDQLRRQAARLSGLTRLAPLLQSYQQLDGELSLLEDAVLRMSIEWDRYVDHQVDLARGK